MTRSLIIGDVQFDTANIRQTALHVMKADGCKQSLDQEQVENHLKECALEVIKNGSHEHEKLIGVKNMQAYFVVEDFRTATFSSNAPHRYEVNFFVRVGHRQER
ncbi:hypothetical protein QUN99_003330 [Vibrio parahaemolyticus]|nr:hypothetical protein [Vibrio parahaemolyticus]